MQAIKGKTSRHRYFVAASGNVTDEVLVAHIEHQDVDREDEDFKVSE